jgi:hypothetical protein
MNRKVSLTAAGIADQKQRECTCCTAINVSATWDGNPKYCKEAYPFRNSETIFYMFSSYDN